MWRRSVGRVVDWPPSPGRFVVGNPESAVAVCTLSSTALIDQLNSKHAAIIGRVYTANLGIEKMIVNIISNPRLRYLVLCGKESPIFRVGETVLLLQKHGVDELGNIPGSEGFEAALPNLPREAVETFQKQFELIDLIGEVNPKKIDKVLEELHKRNTPPYAEQGMFVSSGNHVDDHIELQANRRKWLELDPLGYFFINLDRENNELVVEHFTTDRKLNRIIRGRAADMLYHTIIDEKLISQMDHAAYLGAELAKAETALYYNLNYEQDRKLKVDDRPA
jgi:tetrahydromethanopterin S-methyltransferase subunit A